MKMSLKRFSWWWAGVSGIGMLSGAEITMMRRHLVTQSIRTLVVIALGLLAGCASSSPEHRADASELREGVTAIRSSQFHFDCIAKGKAIEKVIRTP